MGYSEAAYVVGAVTSKMKSGIEPTEVIPKVVSDNGYIDYSAEAYDTIVDGQTLCSLGGVIVTCKLGAIPSEPGDGFYNKEFKGKEGIATLRYITTRISDLTNGVRYYLRFWPYSENKVFSYSQKNVITCDVQEHKIYGITISNLGNEYQTGVVTYDSNTEHMQPMMTNSTKGAITHGTWDSWSWFSEIKPYMVRPDGTVDYELDPNDYTKKKDGSPSDVNNPNYEGGAFVWFPKLYISADIKQSSRYIYSYSTKEISNSYPAGFVDPEGNILEGVWIPMFYMTATSISNNSNKTISIVMDATAQYSELNKRVKAFSNRAHLLGGPIMGTIRDVQFLLYRDVGVLDVMGESYTNYESDPPLVNNHIVNHGSCYGGARIWGKLFHSLVLGSYGVCLLDPYISKINDEASGGLRLSLNYGGGESIGIYNVWGYNGAVKYVSGFSSLDIRTGRWPGGGDRGNADQGFNSRMYQTNNAEIKAGTLGISRFGYKRHYSGVSYIQGFSQPWTGSRNSVACILLPPPNYKP